VRPRLPSFASLGLIAFLGVAALVVKPAAGAPGRLIPTAIVDEGHAGLAHWFAALRAVEEGRGVARALHYGDSTIAADGLARTVRERLAARFGDAGPGFVSGGLTPAWNARADIASSRAGGWEWRTILLGGAGGRYGLGGIVGILRPGAHAVVRAIDAARNPVVQRHVELWYQGGSGYGSYWVSADDREIGRGSAAAAATDDRRFTLDVPEGFAKLAFGAQGGTVPIYGFVLETGKPGTTWESLGVIGVGSKSFTTFAKDGLRPQMEQRKPDLVVVMLGGNEAGYPSLLSKGGEAYQPIFDAALDTILAGKGPASCLVLAPLDQGFVDEADGLEKARPGMKNLVAAQARSAAAHGCAFWSTFDAMGGPGSALQWAHTRGMGTGDLVHLTGAGLAMLGEMLADALIADYERWKGL
jgi:lysophospholipase L1-like esterase